MGSRILPCLISSFCAQSYAEENNPNRELPSQLNITVSHEQESRERRDDETRAFECEAGVCVCAPASMCERALISNAWRWRTNRCMSLVVPALPASFSIG